MKKKETEKKILFGEGMGKERLGGGGGGRRTKKRKNERMEKELKILMEGILKTKTKKNKSHHSNLKRVGGGRRLGKSQN